MPFPCLQILLFARTGVAVTASIGLVDGFAPPCQSAFGMSAFTGFTVINVVS